MTNPTPEPRWADLTDTERERLVAEARQGIADRIPYDPHGEPWISMAREEIDEEVRADLRDRWQGLSEEDADAVFFGLLDLINLDGRVELTPRGVTLDDARQVFDEVETYGASAYLRDLELA